MNEPADTSPPPARLTRRALCRRLGMAVPLALPGWRLQAATEPPAGMTLGIGNYGMQSFKVEDALRLISGIGFDSVELALMDDWDSAPGNLSPERRRAVRKLLDASGLALSSLMEDLPPSSDGNEHRRSLDRLQRAAALGHDLSPDRPPLIQTVLGDGEWNEQRDLFRDRVGDWLRVAEPARTIIAVKPHRSGALSRPSEAVWLFEQLGRSPWLGMVYDYSHYAFRDLSLADTVRTAAPCTVHLAVKDAVQRDDRVEFALPGEAGTVDYRAILSAFHQQGYRRDVCCEVSSQVFRRAGYDAAEAARASYNQMRRHFEEAGVPRRMKSR